MASLESAPVAIAGAGVGAATRVMRAVATLRNAVVDWARARDTRAQLMRLSDHELNDIGLTRGDIARM